MHQGPSRLRVIPRRTPRVPYANRNPSHLTATNLPVRRRLARPAHRSAVPCLPGTDPPPYLSLDPLLPAVGAKIINTVAGRLPLSGVRPNDPEGLVWRPVLALLCWKSAEEKDDRDYLGPSRVPGWNVHVTDRASRVAAPLRVHAVSSTPAETTGHFRSRPAGRYRSLAAFPVTPAGRPPQ